MQHEFGFGGLVRQERIRMCAAAAFATLLVVFLPVIEKSADRWTIGGLAVCTLVFLFGLQRAVKTMQTSAVVVHPEGLRYGHLPESQLVPWATMHSVRERRFAQRIDLLDAEGQVCFRLYYKIEGFAELRDLVLKNVPLALPAPVRFRRSRGWDIFMTLSWLSMFVTFVALDAMWGCFGILACGYALYEDSKSPYAVQVTERELILSFLFRTRTIPLQILNFVSTTEIHEGIYVQLLSVEDPRSMKPILIRDHGSRNIGIGMMVLKATLLEAIRRNPVNTCVESK